MYDFIFLPTGLERTTTSKGRTVHDLARPCRCWAVWPSSLVQMSKRKGRSHFHWPNFHIFQGMDGDGTTYGADWCCDYHAMIQCLVAVCCSVAQVVISNPFFTLLISSNYATPYTAISTGGWDEPLIFSNRNRRSPWNLRGLALRCPAAFDIFDWSFCTISCWIVHFVKGKLQKLLTQQQN